MIKNFHHFVQIATPAKQFSHIQLSQYITQGPGKQGGIYFVKLIEDQGASSLK